MINARIITTWLLAIMIATATWAQDMDPHDITASALLTARAALTDAANANDAAAVRYRDALNQIDQRDATLRLRDEAIASLQAEVARLEKLLGQQPDPPVPDPDPGTTPAVDLSGVPATWRAGDPIPDVTFVTPAGTYGFAGLLRTDTLPWIDLLDLGSAAPGKRTLYAAVKRASDGVILSEATRAITIEVAATHGRPTISVSTAVARIKGGLLENATIDGTGLSGEHVFSFDGINAAPVNDVTIRNVTILHRPNQDAIFAANCTNWLIEDVLTKSVGTQAAVNTRHHAYFVGMKGLTIRRWKAEGSSNYFLNIRLGTKANGVKGQARDILIEDSVADGTGNFIALGSYGGQGKNVTIRNCVARNIGVGWSEFVAGINAGWGGGVDVRQFPIWDGVLIEGNYFESSKGTREDACVRIESSVNVVVRNNRVGRDWRLGNYKAFSPDSGGNVVE